MTKDGRGVVKNTVLRNFSSAMPKKYDTKLWDLVESHIFLSRSESIRTIVENYLDKEIPFYEHLNEIEKENGRIINTANHKLYSLEQLEKLSNLSGLSKAELIRQAIRDYLKYNFKYEDSLPKPEIEEEKYINENKFVKVPEIENGKPNGLYKQYKIIKRLEF